MSILVPRLWPFLSHTTSSVRKSTLQTLKTLTQCNAVASAEQDGGPSNGSDQNQSVEGTATPANTSDLDRIMNVDAKKLSLNFGVKDWPANLLQEALRQVCV